MANALIKVGGVACIIWLVGIILSSTGFWVQQQALIAVGGIIMGVSILLLGLAGIGFWQQDKSSLSVLTGIFGIVGGVMLLAGGAIIFANNGIVGIIGTLLTGVFLMLFGLVLVKQQARLNTQARLGIDLTYPAILTVFIAGSIHFNGQISVLGPAVPAALLTAIVLFLAQ